MCDVHSILNERLERRSELQLITPLLPATASLVTDSSGQHRLQHQARPMAKRRHPTPSASRQARSRPDELIDSMSPRLQAAHRLWSSGQQADALSLFAEAIRLEPNNVRTYVMGARANAEKFDFSGMERVHEMLLQLAPRHPGAHHYIGETYGQLKLPDRAIASYEQAAQLPGAGPPTWMELARLYERAHRLDEAEELIKRTMKAGYETPLAALAQGRIQRRQNRHEQAEATFRALIERTPADNEFACQAWAEIAQLKDLAGDWDGAIEAIENCKRVQRSHEGPHLAAAAKLESRIRDMIEGITQADFRRWRDSAAHLPPRRVALLTGFPRSGTTLLEQVLDAHPDLISSEERDFVGKELLYTWMAQRGATPLLDILNERGASEIELQRERYFQAMEYLLGEPIANRMHLDKNPSYNLMIPLMLRLFPESRLILALRDPRDVVLSCYLRYLPLNSVSVQFLNVQRTAERYAFDMSAWLKVRALIEVPWCEVCYEDTVADVGGQARKALATLDLGWDDQVLNYRQRLTDTKKVTSPSYEAVAQPIYTRAVGRWKNYEQYMEPALATLEPFIREFGYEV
jgi:tetratricopeptide (TPR) repeat protein